MSLVRSAEVFRRRRTDCEWPLLRIARILTAVLARPVAKGLSPSPDGFFPVKDLLKLPVLEGLDFFSIERAVRTHRPHHITLTYNPRNTNTTPTDDNESITSWWIALRSSRTLLHPRRLVQSDQVPDMVFKVPSVHWDTVREQGISRWHTRPLLFHTRHTVPATYTGDYTFIQLDPQKLLDSTNYPIYSTRRHSTRPRFQQPSETFTTNAPSIPPSAFKSATRVAVERFPLMVAASTLSNASPTNRKKKRRPTKKMRKKEKEKEKEKESQPEKMVVLQSGIEALDKFGYRDMLRGTKLLQLWKEQEAEKARQTSNRNPSQEVVASHQVASTTSNPKTLKSGRRLSIKDPPHLTRM